MAETAFSARSRKDSILTSSISANLNVGLTGYKSENTGDSTSPVAQITANFSQLLQSAFTFSWNATTNPNGTELWIGTITLSTGAATIDLTNLTQAGLATAVNATGLKVRTFACLADAGNANVIQIGTGASNGYTGIGVQSLILAGTIRVVTCQGTAVIDSTHKTLDIAGTGSQLLYAMLVFGT